MSKITGFVEREWWKYAQACYGVSRVPPLQYRETRQAFLSGMLTAYVAMADISDGHDQTDAAAMLTEFCEELKAEILTGMMERGARSQ